MSSDPERRVGTLISGRYRLERVASKNATGALFEAEHTLMRKRIAVKVLDAESAARADLRARFEREAIAGAHVDHPNVAAAKDFGTLDDGAQFLVMDALDGPSLREVLAGGSLPLDRVLSIARQIATALAAAHAVGIVHRALSPDTVYVLTRGADRDLVKVVDFGAALLPDHLVSAGSVAPDLRARVTTPVGPLPAFESYAAPELAGGSPIDGRADLYSLGVLIAEMITGSANEPASAVASASVPTTLKALVGSLVATAPEDRPATAAGVASSVEMVVVDRQGMRLSLTSEREVSRPSVVSIPSFATAPVIRFTTDEPVKRAQQVPVPRPILALLAGGVAIVATVAGAVALRAPLDDEVDVDGGTETSSAVATDGGGVVNGTPNTSAAAAASADAGPSLDLRELRARIDKDVRTGKLAAAVADIDTFARADPNAGDDRELRVIVMELSMNIMTSPGPEVEQLFDVLSKRMGTRGIDLLYELVTAHGGSRAAKRADELLHDPQVLARGSPAMRVALDLHNTKNCQEKVGLFPRAKSDGDYRTYGQLQEVNRACRRNRSGRCCLGGTPGLREAIEAIKLRMSG